MPVYAVLSLVVTLSSMGLPGLNGFVGEFSILLGSIGGATLGPSPWIYTAFATTGVILAAIYLLKMYQGMFMGPLDNPKNKELRDLNGGELAIMLSFLLFIVWIGVAPAGYFTLIDASVSDLVQHLQPAIDNFVAASGG